MLRLMAALSRLWSRSPTDPFDGKQANWGLGRRPARPRLANGMARSETGRQCRRHHARPCSPESCPIRHLHRRPTLPEVGIATVRLLRRAGFEVDFPTSQTCCGQPFFNSELGSEPRRLAQRMIEIFEPYNLVVAPSGSCVAMVRAEFPHLFEHDPAWQQRANQLADKTYELSEFLAHIAQSRPTLPAASPPSTLHSAPSTAPRITYHDSCHMNRLLHLKQEPRALLASAGYQIDEMSESERCCGFGGLVLDPHAGGIQRDDRRQAAPGS